MVGNGRVGLPYSGCGPDALADELIALGGNGRARTFSLHRVVVLLDQSSCAPNEILASGLQGAFRQSCSKANVMPCPAYLQPQSYSTHRGAVGLDIHPPLGIAYQMCMKFGCAMHEPCIVGVIQGKDPPSKSSRYGNRRRSCAVFCAPRKNPLKLGGSSEI